MVNVLTRAVLARVMNIAAGRTEPRVVSYANMYICLTDYCP